MVTTAARTRKSVLESDDRKACAAPWNVSSIAGGNGAAAAVRSIASTAAPSAKPGARLNETVIAGNCPTWLITKVADPSRTCATLVSLTGLPELLVT